MMDEDNLVEEGGDVDSFSILLVLFGECEMMKQCLLFYSLDHYHKISSKFSLRSWYF